MCICLSRTIAPWLGQWPPATLGIACRVERPDGRMLESTCMNVILSLSSFTFVKQSNKVSRPPLRSRDVKMTTIALYQRMPSRSACFVLFCSSPRQKPLQRIDDSSGGLSLYAYRSLTRMKVTWKEINDFFTFARRRCKRRSVRGDTMIV